MTSLPHTKFINFFSNQVKHLNNNHNLSNLSRIHTHSNDYSSLVSSEFIRVILFVEIYNHIKKTISEEDVSPSIKNFIKEKFPNLFNNPYIKLQYKKDNFDGIFHFLNLNLCSSFPDIQDTIQKPVSLNSISYGSRSEEGFILVNGYKFYMMDTRKLNTSSPYLSFYDNFSPFINSKNQNDLVVTFNNFKDLPISTYFQHLLNSDLEEINALGDYIDIARINEHISFYPYSRYGTPYKFFEETSIYELMEKYKENFYKINLHQLCYSVNYFPQHNSNPDPNFFNNYSNILDAFIKNSNEKELVKFFKKLANMKNNFGYFKDLDSFNIPKLSKIENVLKSNIHIIPEIFHDEYLMLRKITGKNNKPFTIIEQPKLSINFQININKLKSHFSTLTYSNEMHCILNLTLKMFKKSKKIDNYVINYGKSKFKDIAFILLLKINDKTEDETLLKELNESLLSITGYVLDNIKEFNSSSNQFNMIEQYYREFILNKKIDTLEIDKQKTSTAKKKI